jgi:hypothetical protein
VHLFVNILSYTGVKLGLSEWFRGQNCGECLDLKETKERNRENYMMKRFTICARRVFKSREMA